MLWIQVLFVHNHWKILNYASEIMNNHKICFEIKPAMQWISAFGGWAQLRRTIYIYIYIYIWCNKTHRKQWNIMKCKYNKMEIAKIVGMDFSAPQRISKICHLRVLWICIRFFVSKSWEGGSANMAQQRPANPYHKNPYGHAAYHLVWICMLGGLRGDGEEAEVST